MLTRLDRLAYHSQHLSFLINATVMQEAARLVTRTPRPQLAPTVLRALQRRRDELHAAISRTSRPGCIRASCCSTSRCAATCARCRG